MLNGDEVCEGADLGVSDCEMEGFDGGNLACAADCTYDTSDCSMCGDGFANGFEPCDGADLGGETCASLGLDGGTLACTAGCTYDFSMCDIAGIPFGSDSGYNGFSLSPVILPCDEISATGTATGLFDDDAVSVPIGFTFPFYGVNYTDVSIQSNGALRFGDNTVIDYDNACPVPTAQAPSSNSLWVFWDDLDPSEFNAAVYYQTLGPAGAQRMVVQWDVPFFFGDLADFLRFQAVLHQSGNIDVCFVDMTNGAAPGNFGAEATIGIQQNSTDGFSFSCNAPNATNGTMLLYLPI
jgi:hypothetical protein